MKAVALVRSSGLLCGSDHRGPWAPIDYGRFVPAKRNRDRHSWLSDARVRIIPTGRDPCGPGCSGPRRGRSGVVHGWRTNRGDGASARAAHGPREARTRLFLDQVQPALKTPGAKAARASARQRGVRGAQDHQ